MKFTQNGKKYFCTNIISRKTLKVYRHFTIFIYRLLCNFAKYLPKRTKTINFTPYFAQIYFYTQNPPLSPLPLHSHLLPSANPAVTVCSAFPSLSPSSLFAPPFSSLRPGLFSPHKRTIFESFCSVLLFHNRHKRTQKSFQTTKKPKTRRTAQRAQAQQTAPSLNKKSSLSSFNKLPCQNNMYL